MSEFTCTDASNLNILKLKTMAKHLFSPATLGSLSLQNRVVMAPMTRSRAAQNNTPNALIATYYAQRASAGLIITEGTAPSPNGLGYARIPGIYTQEQIDGWKLTTRTVHEKGSKIFIQLMHTGRIGHTANLPAGAKLVAPSAVAAAGEMWTDQQGMQPHPTPEALTTEGVRQTIGEFVQAAVNAIEAGFDGVELHGANGYLIEQFIHPHTNQRTDQYGGSIENRSRFLVEVAQAVANAIGKDQLGVRLSPFSTFNDLPLYDSIAETYQYIAQQLNEIGVQYIHLVDHSEAGTLPEQHSVIRTIRNEFKGVLILCNNYDADRAEKDLQAGLADLIAFGRPFIANPDLVERLQIGAELAQPDYTTAYGVDEKGYTDYPALQKQAV